MCEKIVAGASESVTRTCLHAITVTLLPSWGETITFRLRILVCIVSWALTVLLFMQYFSNDPSAPKRKERDLAGTFRSPNAKIDLDGDFIAAKGARTGQICFYQCLNKTLMFLENPRPELYHYAHADDQRKECSTMFSKDKRVLTLSNCDMNCTVAVALSAKSQPSLFIDDVSDVFLVRCLEPSFAGNFAGLEYKCYDQGTITVTNPRPDLYTHALLDIPSGCRPTFTDLNRKLVITDCVRKNGIILALGAKPLADFQIRRYSNTYIISCD
ncbi:hypothetical protein CHS0354_031553 [Potamilus streckersoni]|uniref:Uncharacterized protein n=1 Tax=Potamilus streckersoni TaxID=2493646 RepID=A0AAE0SZ74_9BIVA|nr:hypothetical protein CHS0354_031553 [Potamilus streckersoni]